MVKQTELSELKNLLNSHLHHGDKSEVAKALGVSRQTVSNTLKSFDLDSPVMDSLIAKATSNKRQQMLKQQLILNKLKTLKG
jgi:transcriptional regulator with XRE-family HTH domain